MLFDGYLPSDGHNRVVAFVTGLVLAAGGSTPAGRAEATAPVQRPDASRPRARHRPRLPFDQLLCVIGASAGEIRGRVDLRGAEVVENRHFGEGCSSSIAAALSAVDPRADVLVLMLGDQPGVTAQTVTSLLAGRGNAPLAACAYEDGRGHPLAFARSTFGALEQLHGDKGVWKLLDRHADQVVDVPVPGRIPRDVDTDADYRAVLIELEVGRSNSVFLVDAQSIARQSCAGRNFGMPRRPPRKQTRREQHRRCDLILIGVSTGWVIGLVLGVVVTLVAAAIVITIVMLANRIAKQARTAVQGVEKVREQTTELGGIARINDSGVRILHSARALRKVAVGK